MDTVRTESLRNLQHVVTTAQHGLIADEPPDQGDGLGPNPYELLLSALGACTSMTLLLYARRKGWPLEGVTVELSHARMHARDCEECEEEDDVMLDVIRRDISLRGNLNGNQRERLAHIARRCPVARTLEAGPRVLDRVEVTG
jgi:putative redox protein